MKTSKTRVEMIAFLTGHFRYSTRGRSSYAANVKLRNLRLPRELEDKAYEALQIEEAFDGVNRALRDFDAAHNWRYQTGFEGRSGGYLVLYRGGRRVSEHKSYCAQCGQRNFKPATEADKTCGRCGKPARVNQVFHETFTTGESVGTNDAAELAEWSTEDLRAEVKLVREFDAAVEEARRAFIATLENSEIEEETYTVQKMRKVLKEKA